MSQVDYGRPQPFTGTELRLNDARRCWVRWMVLSVALEAMAMLALVDASATTASMSPKEPGQRRRVLAKRSSGGTVPDDLWLLCGLPAPSTCAPWRAAQ